MATTKLTFQGRNSMPTRSRNGARFAAFTFATTGMLACMCAPPATATPASPMGTVSAAKKPAYAWYDLADYRQAAASGGIRRASTEYLGTETVSSAVLSSRGSMKWLINGTCTQLRGVAGTHRGSTSAGAGARVDILADNKKVFTRAFASEESTPFSVSLKGAKSVTVGVTSQKSVSGGIGNAEIYCSRPPGKYDPKG